MKYRNLLLVSLLFCLSAALKHHDEYFAHLGESDVVEEEKIVELNFSSITDPAAKWISSSNIGNYLNLHPIKALYLPIELNLIFIGFQGDGHNGINLNEENFERWFEHIEHQIPHTTVPIGEEQTTTHKRPTGNTAVHYRTSIRVVKLCSLVNTVMEDFIYWNLRKEDPNQLLQSEPDVYYVDAFKFSSLLNNLLEYLNLTTSYTLFILNPNTPLGEGERYGYRNGFSASEIEILRASLFLFLCFSNTTQQQANIQMEPPPNLSTHGHSKVATEQKKAPTADRVTHTDYAKESEEWARAYLNTQKQGKSEKEAVECQSADSEEDSNCVPVGWKQSSPITELAQQIIVNGSKFEKAYLYRVLHDERVSASCVLENWISHNRFAFIDLTAGPFEWGPTIATEGAHTQHSLPAVPAQKALDSSRVAAQNTVIQSQSVPASQRAGEEYTAQQLVFAQYFKQFCSTPSQLKSPFCIDLKNRMAAGADEGGILSGSEEEGMDASQAMDDFLAHLSAVISSTVHHVVVPSTPLFKTPYAQRVLFHVFMISDLSAANSTHQYDEFDFEVYQQELLKLKLPTQEFSFSFKKITISEDLSLALAFTSSLRSVATPRLTVDGKYKTDTLFYLDSAQLQSHLHALNPDAHDDVTDTYEATHIQRHIPVFIFSLNYDVPVFIDRYFTAKALSDMVLVVQSDFHWESRVSCNKRSIYLNLANPMKWALSATAQLLGGLIPTHISYNQATQSAVQNWLWSVGDNSLAYTSDNYHFASFHRDTLFRNYIVYSLNDSVNILNEAMSTLQSLKTDEENLQILNILSLQNVSLFHSLAKHLYTEIISAVHKLDFKKATLRIEELFMTTRNFKESVDELSDVLDLFKCVSAEQKKGKDIGWLIPIALAVDVFLVMTFFLFRTKKQKVKVN